MPSPRRLRPHEIETFTQWLRDRGADVLVPMSEWEVLRFVANDQTSILYRNKNDELTWTGEADKAWAAFKGRRKWQAGKTTASGNSKRRPQKLHALITRDGKACWFCFQELEDSEITIEHLVARSSGGPNHLDNLVIACEPCNAKAHTMSVAEKVALRAATAPRHHGS